MPRPRGSGGGQPHAGTNTTPCCRRARGCWAPGCCWCTNSQPWNTQNWAKLGFASDSFHGGHGCQRTVSRQMDGGPHCSCVARGQRPHLWCPTIPKPLHRLFCAVVHKGDSRCWNKPPQLDLKCQKKALRLLSSLVLLLLCKGAENYSNTKHRHHSSKCLFSPPKTLPAIFNTIWESVRQGAFGNFMAKGKRDKGGEQESFTEHITFWTLLSSAFL